MENEIIDALDKLTVDQTDRLLGETMEMNIDTKTSTRIKNSVYKKIGSTKKSLYIPHKLVACVAAILIAFVALSFVGFDRIATAISDLLTFIPGVGITEKSNDTIYMMDPIVQWTSSEDVKANMVSAVYSNDYLTITVEVFGKYFPSFSFEDFSLYFNGSPIDFINRDRGFANDRSYASLSGGANTALLCLSIRADEPTYDDLYEIAVEGFSERLSFRMTPCLDYNDIKNIGPTDIQNGISITTTTQRIDNQLIVWCYPFITTNSTNDRILEYGIPSNDVFFIERYIDTESGRVSSTRDRIGSEELAGRLIFDLPDENQTVTLHIPYLSMFREEKVRLNLDFPKEYITVDSDISITCSLGTIRITEITRAPDTETEMDTIQLKLEFDSNDSKLALSSFDFDPKVKYRQSAGMGDAESGCATDLILYVGKNDKKISFDITGFYYYLFGEYVIPLDIQ